MLLLGFGFLMTFLSKYGLSAVGFALLLSAIAIQLNIFMELFCRFIYGEEEDTAFPLPLKVPTFIDGEFAAATLMISFGAIIGYVVLVLRSFLPMKLLSTLLTWKFVRLNIIIVRL